MSKILNLVAKTGLKYKKVASGTKRGDEYASACPGCGGRDRFRFWPSQGDGGSWWCRRCNQGGDCIEFLRVFEKLSFKEAVKRLGQDEKLNRYRALPQAKNIAQTQSFQPAANKEMPPEKWQKQAQKIVEHAHQTLLEKTVLKDWLLNQRGLEEETLIQHQLGWLEGENNKGCYYRARSAWGLEDIKLEDKAKRIIWIPRGLLIPSKLNGSYVGLRIRRSASEQKEFASQTKYYVIPGSIATPLIVKPLSAKVAPVTMVLESELDAMLVASEAERFNLTLNVIALQSVAAKPNLGAHQILKAASLILVSLDYDKPGESASRWWLKNYPQAKRWPVPLGKDPSDYFKQAGLLGPWLLAGWPEALRK